MKINTINNTNFESKWIKIAKPKNTKLAEDCMQVGLGLSSIFTGLDAFSIIPSTVANTMIDVSASSAKHDIIDTGLSLTYLTSCPVGSMNSCYGSYGITKTMIDKKNSEKKIPS